MTLKMEEVCSAKRQVLSELHSTRITTWKPNTLHSAVRTTDPTEVTSHVVPINWQNLEVYSFPDVPATVCNAVSWVLSVTS